ncbi:MAG: sulfate ABC transporter ATP-binding protein [Euryarchaeota archaeon]|nr:sulfate ABC transporter ATP-binding protein [Euryarchaeota archaeon]
MSNAVVSMHNVCKKFSDLSLFSDLNLVVNKGEIIAIIGPSGCGKTTLLRMICGLENDYTGSIRFEGRDISENHVQDKIGFIFQKPILFPHLNVGRNILLGYKQKGSKKLYNEIIERELQFIGLPGFAKRRVESLSGGESQRVALARALLANPELLLLDEPFSSLDVSSRRTLTTETRHFIKSKMKTAIHVTHDEEEAKIIADRVIYWHELVEIKKTTEDKQ